MKFEITSKVEDYKNPARRALLRIFVEADKRPGKAANGPPDNVLEHLEWRHQVDLREIAHDREFRAQVRIWMTANLGKSESGYEDVHFQFSTKAGCSCPCSPGIIVQDAEWRGRIAPPAIYINIIDESPKLLNPGIVYLGPAHDAGHDPNLQDLKEEAEQINDERHSDPSYQAVEAEINAR
jgi:hypothetical protein